MRYFSIIGGVIALALATSATSAKAGSFEEKAQVTVGGAESVITGYLVKMDDDAYWIRQATGDVALVKVNESTNLICRTRPGTPVKVEHRPGIGFRMGDCPFARGDTVRVDVSALGWATLVRFMDELPTPLTRKLGLPQGWEGEIPHGVLAFEPTPPFPVYTKDGKHVGHLAGTLLDTGLGTRYGLLIHEPDQHMMPVPWTRLRQEFPESNKIVVVVLLTKERLEQVHPPMFSAAHLISIKEVRDFWVKTPTPEPTVSKEVDVEIVMNAKAYEVTKGGGKGGPERSFELMAGMPATIRLHNRDTVAHEFLSSLFHDVPFRISGNGTMIKTANASGIRLDPGQQANLEFIAPLAEEDQFGTVASIYDVFWCGIHGAEHGNKLRGEMLVVETRGEIGGG